MFLFFASFVWSLNPKYAALVEKARKRAAKRSLQTINEEDLSPGNYHLETCSYTLVKKITGDRSSNVDGYAQDETNLAIIRSNKKTTLDIDDSFVFVNSKDQKMYSSLKLVDSDAEVQVYEIKETDPFNVVKNIKMSTSPLLWGRISKSYGMNWKENGDPFFKGRPESLKSICNGMDFGLGFYVDIALELNFDISGWGTFVMDIGVFAKSTFGAQLVIDNPTIDFPDFKLLNGSIKIPNGLSFSILGWDFGVETGFEFDLLIRDIKLDLELKLDLFKGYLFSFEKHVTVSSESDTIEFSDNIFSVDEISSNVDIVNTLKQAVINFQFTPTIDLILYVILSAGTKEYGKTSIVLSPNIPFKFTYDVNACPFPHLQGNIKFKFDFTFNFEGLSLGPIEIDPYDKVLNIFESDPLEFCLFDVRTTNENSLGTKFTSTKVSYKIEPYLKLDYDYEPEKTIILFVYDNNKLSQTINFPYQTYDEIEPKYMGKVLIITNPSENAFINGFGIEKKDEDGVYKYSSQKDYNLETLYKENDPIELIYTFWGVPYTMSITTSFTKGKMVPIGKEFDKDTNVDFILFQTYYDEDEPKSYCIIYKTASEQYLVDNVNKLFLDTMIDKNNDPDSFYGSAKLNGKFPIITVKEIKYFTKSHSFTYAFRRKINNIIQDIGCFIVPARGEGLYYPSQLDLADWSIKTHLIDDDDEIQICSVGSDGSIERFGHLTKTALETVKTWNIKQYVDDVHFLTLSLSLSTFSPIAFSDQNTKAVSMIVTPEYIFKMENTEYVDLIYIRAEYSFITLTIELPKVLDTIKPEKGTLYLPIEIEYYTPLVENIKICNNCYLIPIKTSQSRISVPFRIEGDGMNKLCFTRITNIINSYLDGEVFYNPYKKVCCYQLNSYSMPGCICKSKDLLYYSTRNLYPWRCRFGDYYIVFYHPISTYVYEYFVQFFDPNIIIPKNTLSASLKIDTFAVDKIFVHCTRSLNFLYRFIDSNGKTNDFKAGNVFESSQKFVNGVMTVYPLCENTEESFCIFTLEREASKLYLHNYESSSGIEFFNGSTTFSKGVKSELYQSDDITMTWKRWNGLIRATDVTSSIQNITIKYNFDGDYIIYRFIDSSSNQIPFSISRIIENPSKTMKILGSTETELKPEICEFLSDGSIKQNIHSIYSQISTDPSDIEWLLSLPYGTNPSIIFTPPILPKPSEIPVRTAIPPEIPVRTAIPDLSKTIDVKPDLSKTIDVKPDLSKTIDVKPDLSKTIDVKPGDNSNSQDVNSNNSAAIAISIVVVCIVVIAIAAVVFYIKKNTNQISLEDSSSNAIEMKNQDSEPNDAMAEPKSMSINESPLQTNTTEVFNGITEN